MTLCWLVEHKFPYYDVIFRLLGEDELLDNVTLIASPCEHSMAFKSAIIIDDVTVSLLYN